MKTFSRLLLSIAIAVSGLYAKVSPQSILEALPPTVDHFEKNARIKVYDDSRLGASVAYNRLSILGKSTATVYVYDLGNEVVSDSLIESAHRMGVSDIEEIHSNVKLETEGTKKLDGAGKKVHYSGFELVMDGDLEKSYSYIFVSGTDDYIYKIRVTSNERSLQKDMIELSEKIMRSLPEEEGE